MSVSNNYSTKNYSGSNLAKYLTQLAASTGKSVTDTDNVKTTPGAYSYLANASTGKTTNDASSLKDLTDYVSLVTDTAAADTAVSNTRSATPAATTNASNNAYTKSSTTTTKTGTDYSDLLKKMYEANLANAQANYDTQAANLQSAADKAKQEAYLSYMNAKRGLDQRLAAGGLTGGASESALMGLANEYQNARNTVDSSLASSLASLGSEFNETKNSLYSDYLNSLANNASSLSSTTTTNTSSGDTSGIASGAYESAIGNVTGTAGTTSSLKDLADGYVEKTTGGNVGLGSTASLKSYIQSLIDTGADDDTIVRNAYANMNKYRVPYADEDAYLQAVADIINTSRGYTPTLGKASTSTLDRMFSNLNTTY